MIEISHLVKKYGDHYAVKDLNVQIEEGQIYGFLGPNGAGKSTTMNMITGYLAPTAGTVKVDGFDIVKEPEKAKEHIDSLPAHKTAARGYRSPPSPKPVQARFHLLLLSS